jgi:hypothetical protein
MAPTEYRGIMRDDMNIGLLLKFADDVRYDADTLGEGIVVMTDDDIDQPLTKSFKVISNAYLLEKPKNV